MSTQSASTVHRTTSLPKTLDADPASDDASGSEPHILSADEKASALSPKAAQRILISLMVSYLLMPLASSMSRVALPVIRDDFQITADMTAWVASSFSLPFLILMPIYGRLSDGVGRRRLLLAGIVLFAIGTTITVLATDLTGLMFGRALQGIGTAGMTPLGMALISTIFRAEERGKALGTWSSVGPTMAFIGPLAAGYLIAAWGWRAAFAPPLLFGLIAFLAVAKGVPPGLSNVQPGFLRNFDWTGVLLLAGTLTCFLFYLSSRPITGVDPLQDWRLLVITVTLAIGFIWWERQRTDAFVDLVIFTNSIFTRASLSALVRMFTMGGISFLIPLYLDDIHEISPIYMGWMLMVNPGAMTIMVRFGGQIADRWGSRWPVVIGLSVQTTVGLLLSQLTETSPLWQVIVLLASHGLGVGLMLAALHRAVMSSVADEQMGSAAGLYSMLRFIGMAIGTALAGVLLQNQLDLSIPMIAAYQNVFFYIAGISIIGLGLGFSLREPRAIEAV